MSKHSEYLNFLNVTLYFFVSMLPSKQTLSISECSSYSINLIQFFDCLEKRMAYLEVPLNCYFWLKGSVMKQEVGIY